MVHMVNEPARHEHDSLTTIFTLLETSCGPNLLMCLTFGFLYNEPQCKHDC